jgi:dihydroflavonol-4-reductase
MSEQRARGLAAVSGATGFIGSAVVRKLVAEGRRVRALCEPGAPTKNLEALPAGAVERFSVDVCDLAGMKRALDGCSAFFHLAAIYRVWNPDPRAIYRVNLEGTTTALLAAQAASVPRIVYTSSIAAVGLLPDGRPSDESVEFNLHDIADEYILTKHLSERIAMRFAEVLPIVVVNPAFPFGPGDIAPTPTGKIILALLRGEMPGTGPGGFCAVDVDDVAAAHVAAETKGRVGERYILGNHNLTYAEFAEVVAKVAGIAAPRLYIPGALGLGVTKGMELWSELVSHREPKGTVKGLAYLQRKPFFDAAKARRELDFPCTPLEVSVERAVRFFREQGMA